MSVAQRSGEGAVRLTWKAVADDPRFSECALAKPPAPPPGYTRNTVVTDWLTLNCRGDWASRGGRGSILVRFADPDDLRRARAQFPAAARAAARPVA
jgi:hypothetical protein